MQRTESDEFVLNAVIGGLKDTIRAHGPITDEFILSASKRIGGIIIAELQKRCHKEMGEESLIAKLKAELNETKKKSNSLRKNRNDLLIFIKKNKLKITDKTFWEKGLSVSLEEFQQAMTEFATNSFVRDIERELRRLSPGRNPDCWSLYSFGWKDADLDPEGCTGIRSIRIENDAVVVEVGGHKTVCEPEDESKKEISQFIVSNCGWSGDWTGDDWCLHFKEFIYVQFSNKETVPKVVEKIIEAARVACQPFEKAMAKLSSELDG